VAGLTLALASSATLLGSAPTAQAADKVVFTLVGTSDVSDSDLVYKVLEPRFEALYPQYDLQYVAQGTGAALTTARSGNAAAAIVHAAGIENQFVADGYSMEQYGRLVFWGDYVLLGPNSDPAGVAASASTDIVSAFEKVAAAGAAGTATFVTRGGTPGTAVQEHALWKLTSGVPTCVVGNPAGGGTRPVDPTDPNLKANCTAPDDENGADGDGAKRPAWYKSGSSTSQAQNINIANTCSFPQGNCYVFTDRGTYKNLRAQGLAQNLKIVTRDNNPAARGGRDALINVFHAYGVNPAKFANPAATKTDPVAAKLFLDFITSTTTQEAIGAFLAEDGDQAFIPAAAPVNTTEPTLTSYSEGRKAVIKGAIANAVPGYPTLSGVPVNLLRVSASNPLAVPKVVATTTTDANGAYKLRKASLKTGFDYRVGVPQIAKVELPLLNPAFGSLITAASTDLGTVTGYQVKNVKSLSNGRFVMSGKLKTKSDGAGKIKVLAGQGKKLKRIGVVKLKNNKSKFAFRGRLAPGKHNVQLVFSDKGETVETTSKVFKVTTTR
jgi:tungstate transport system substrate-binding protein